MIVSTTVAGLDRLVAALRARALLLARAARARRAAGADAAWRRADLLWPGFSPPPPPKG